MADSLKGRRKRGTGNDSILRMEKLMQGFPTRDPITGEVTVRRSTSNPILIQPTLRGPMAEMRDMVVSAFNMVDEAAPKPPVMPATMTALDRVNQAETLEHEENEQTKRIKATKKKRKSKTK